MLVNNEGSNSCCGRPQGECSCEKAKTPDYSGAGAGQIIPPVQNKADDKLPAGGSLGMPVWNFAASPTNKASQRQFAVANGVADDKLPAGGALGVPVWNF
jgi:hypothetical protein